MKHYYKPNQKRSNIKDFDLVSKKIDVRSLDRRETKMNTRKGLLPVENEKKPVCAIIQLPLFGNPVVEHEVKQVPEDIKPLNPEELPDLDTDLASFQPDYVRKRAKYGYKVL